MDVQEIWDSIISKPKWYAGIENTSGKFYTAQTANKVKLRFARGTLSQGILEKILNAHGYSLKQQWVKN